jgi:hypothetical protein
MMRAADLEEGRIYRVREMPDLAREMLEHFDRAVKRSMLERAMSGGLNIEAAGHRLPDREEFQMKQWDRELEESAKHRGEMSIELPTPPPQRPYQIFVRGNQGTKICHA